MILNLNRISAGVNRPGIDNLCTRRQLNRIGVNDDYMETGIAFNAADGRPRLPDPVGDLIPSFQAVVIDGYPVIIGVNSADR